MFRHERCRGFYFTKYPMHWTPNWYLSALVYSFYQKSGDVLLIFPIFAAVDLHQFFINSFVCIDHTELLCILTQLSEFLWLGYQFFYCLAQTFSSQIFFFNQHCCVIIDQYHSIMVLMIFCNIWGWNQDGCSPRCFQLRKGGSSCTADYQICCSKAVIHIVDVLTDIDIGILFKVCSLFPQHLRKSSTPYFPVAWM